MRNRSSKKKKRQDVNVLAKDIVDEATFDDSTQESTEESTQNEGKNPNAVALGRLGGLKGGKARAKKLTKKERSESARKAALARWEKTQESE